MHISLFPFFVQLHLNSFCVRDTFYSLYIQGDKTELQSSGTLQATTVNNETDLL